MINTGGPLKRNIASIRNTVVHETVHWFFHRNYFELSQLLDNSLTHAVCYKGGYAENNDIARMERQTRALTPRILMPKKQFLNKFKELSKEIDELSKTIPLNRIEKWHKMIVCLSRFFGVSYQSTKYRLKELGKTRADGVFNYIDGNYIQEFTFKSNYLKEHQTFVIERCSALRLLKTDKRIRQAFEEGKLAYVNNMFVLNDGKYIDYKKNILTEYAQNNAHECCLVFDITSELDKVDKQNKKRCFMFSGSEAFKIEAKLSRDSLTYILQNYKQESNDFKKMCNSGEISKSFYKELNKYFKKSGYTQTLFAEESDINVKYIREILNGTRTPTLIQVVRMGIVLNLSYPVIKDMLLSLGLDLTSTTDDNMGLIFCLSFYKGTLTMEQIYEELRKTGYGNVLQLTKRYIKNHNLIEISE